MRRSRGCTGFWPPYGVLVTVDAVLFDFSGTLFRFEPASFDGLVDGEGQPWDASQRAELMRKLTAPTGDVVALEPEYQEAWQRRDLDPKLHRKVYLEVLRLSGLASEHARAVYARLLDPLSWVPYPDTGEALRSVRRSGARVAVVSNIAFDIRLVFDRLGLLDQVDEVLMSYTEGVMKPDPALFRRACARLEAHPERTLMVGDSELADGAAAEVGCSVALVEPIPTAQRPDGLLSVLADHGLVRS
jgi:HAD superfamily hydrolase (TIGR01509 family)